MKKETNTPIYLKVTCLTPKGQAKKCMREWARQFPSFKKPIKKEILNDTSFYWIYKFENEKKMLTFNKKVLLAENGIKRTYRFMLKFFLRAYKILNKSAWGVKKTKRWLEKQWKKRFDGESSEINKIKELTDEKFKEYLKINDEEEIRQFLEKEIISTKFSYDARKFKEW